MDIEVEKLRIISGDFTLDADFRIASGERVAIIGPSGGGKSTLLMCLAGFQEVAEGVVRFGGQDQRGIAPQDRPVSVLFQEHNLFPHLTVAENTALGIAPSLKLGASGRQRVAQALVEVGLDGMGARYPDSLSGGQRQRVALARALLRDRPVLLLDEPFAALGPGLRFEMLDLVARIQEQHGTTVLLVTHSPEDAQRIAPRTLLVADGTVTGPFATGPLLSDPPDSLRKYLGR